MTFPKGSPKEMTSPSVTSLGSLRMWITLEGTPALRLSPLNFLLSFPFAAEAELPLMIKGPLVTHAEKSSSDPRLVPTAMSGTMPSIAHRGDPRGTEWRRRNSRNRPNGSEL